MHIQNFEEALERDIIFFEKIFVTCCCLQNFLLDIMVRHNVRVGRGYPIGDDGLWLSRHTYSMERDTERFAIKFGLQRALLAKHLHVFQKLGPIPDD